MLFGMHYLLGAISLAHCAKYILTNDWARLKLTGPASLETSCRSVLKKY
jgi:hypothetical protein